MKIEEGKEYKTRLGLTAFVLKIDESKNLPIMTKIKGYLGCFFFYKDGKYFDFIDSEWDLVEEVKEEQEGFSLKFDQAWLVNQKGTIKEGWASKENWGNFIEHMAFNDSAIWSIDKKRIKSISNDETIFFDIKESKEYSEECKISYRKSLEEKAEKILAELKALK